MTQYITVLSSYTSALHTTSEGVTFRYKSPHKINPDRLFIKPYGANTTRYELEPVLELSASLIYPTHNLIHNLDTRLKDGLKSESESESEYEYAVSIAKICPISHTSRTAGKFWKTRMDIPLEIWTPKPDSPHRPPASNPIISSLLPPRYGTVTATEYSPAEIKIKNKFRLGIVVPLFSRSDYVEQFLDSLKRSVLDDCMIVLMDESTTAKNITADHQRVRQMVADFELDDSTKNAALVKVSKRAHGNMHDSILYGMDLMYDYCDFLSTIDSDTIQNRDWITRMFAAFDSVDSPCALMSGFNVVSTRHVVTQVFPQHILKTSVGGCHMFFNRSIYPAIIRPCLISHKWDSNIVDNARRHGLIIATTNPSVVQHIGVNTSVTHRAKTRKEPSPDIALDFIDDDC